MEFSVRFVLMNLTVKSLISRQLFLCFALGVGTVSIQWLHAADLETSIDTLFKRFDRPNAPGLAVGVVKKGSILYAKGWGMADLEHDIPLTPDSVFDIASVSKQFAGLAIAMLRTKRSSRPRI